MSTSLIIAFDKHHLLKIEYTLQTHLLQTKTRMNLDTNLHLYKTYYKIQFDSRLGFNQFLCFSNWTLSKPCNNARMSQDIVVRLFQSRIVLQVVLQIEVTQLLNANSERHIS